MLAHNLECSHDAIGILLCHMDRRSAAIRFYSVGDSPFLLVGLDDSRVPQGFEGGVHQVPGGSPVRVEEGLMRTK